MREPPRRITDVVLSVSADPGHDGLLSTYRVDAGEDAYAVTLTVSRPSLLRAAHARPAVTPSRSPQTPPASPAGGDSAAWRMVEVLTKGRRQVEEFLSRLSDEFGVFELGDLRPAHPFLHPTFHSFSFRDSAGRGHSFEYNIECSNHLDERYRRLVEEFGSFFESGRVFAKFLERVRRGA